MSLSAGTHLGPYEILSPLGAGGMGEVYRARDPRMGRDVAIKLAAERFSDRFDREVRAVAALNHANICQIYDVGPNYLVMELVEGPTLADRIKAGALPLEEALTIGRQIADALEAAHEKGIIHRDLKPANIKVKPDGTVKVLDFGLAKMAEQTAASTSPEDSPTLQMGATLAGQIMGTAAYMAPEQARGKPVDKRADIWAFGVVLYEMLTGRRLFEGETISDILAGVLTREPDWNRVPAKARRLIQRCLEKDPKRRLRDIADAWALLDDVPVSPVLKGGVLWKIAAGVLAAISAISLWVAWRAARPAETAPSLVRIDFDLGPDISLASGIGPAAILSPDATRLVFVAQGQDGTRRLFTRRLDQPKATPLAKTEGAYTPFFSPDGQWVGFFARGKLQKTRIDGGEPIPLCDASSGRGAAWIDDGSIIAALDAQGGLSQILPGGAKPVSITELSLGEVTHRWPSVLPGGKAVLFTASTEYGNYSGAGISVVFLQDHLRKVVLEHAGMYPRYLPSGHLVYVTRGTLFASPFDLERLEARGPAAVLEGVSSNPTLGLAEIDFSRNGTITYQSGGRETPRTIQWLDGAGKTVSLGNAPGWYSFTRLSPDGSRVVLQMNQGVTSDLWIYDWKRSSTSRLTNGLTVNGNTAWSPDGKYLVFGSAARGMFWVRADGGKPQPLTQSKNPQFAYAFSPDGKHLVFSEAIPGAGAEIRILPVDSQSGQLRGGEPQLFLKTPNTNNHAAFSPDGRWLAYGDAEGGQYEVYVRAFPDNGSVVQVSNAGGVMPVWSRTAHELFYRTEDQRIMAMNYTVKGGAFVAEKPRVWSARQLADVGMVVNFDLAPDGKRFVTVMPVETPELRESRNHVIVGLNFFNEVRRCVAGQAK
jgi:Tol biopolymer transport system component/predicted Ser/Thr protein kinase